MSERSLPNSAASDLVSVLQLHFDVAGIESPDLVKKTFLSFAGGQLANFLTKQLAGIELGALIACSTGCS